MTNSPSLPQNHKPASLLLLPSAGPQREEGLLPKSFPRLPMDRCLCLGPRDSSKQILPSPSFSNSHPPPVTPTFYQEGSLSPKPTLSLREGCPPQPCTPDPLPSWLTLHPHTCLERWQRTLQEPVPAWSLSSSSRSLPAHTLYLQPHKHTRSTTSHTEHLLSPQPLPRGQALTHDPPSSQGTVSLHSVPYPLHLT